MKAGDKRMPLMHATADALEFYVLNLLQGPDLEFFEEHILVCENCRCALEAVQQEIRQLQQCLRQDLEERSLEDRRRIAQSGLDNKDVVLFR